MRTVTRSRCTAGHGTLSCITFRWVHCPWQNQVRYPKITTGNSEYSESLFYFINCILGYTRGLIINISLPPRKLGKYFMKLSMCPQVISLKLQADILVFRLQVDPIQSPCYLSKKYPEISTWLTQQRWANWASCMIWSLTAATPTTSYHCVIYRTHGQSIGQAVFQGLVGVYCGVPPYGMHIYRGNLSPSVHRKKP